LAPTALEEKDEKSINAKKSASKKEFFLSESLFNIEVCV
jgi:hypothetical protein